MNDQPPDGRRRDSGVKLDAVHRPLVEGQESDNAQPLEAAEMKREAREVALDRLRRAVAEGEASGEAVPFDMDTWLEEQDRLDSAA